MSNYSSLKATINANVKANGNQEITGPVMNSVLNAMVDSLGTGYQYKGKAFPSTNPGTPDSKVYYLASEPGTYTNFNGIVVPEGEVAILKWDTAWSKEVTGAATAAQVTQLGQELYGQTGDTYIDVTSIWEKRENEAIVSDGTIQYSGSGYDVYVVPCAECTHITGTASAYTANNMVAFYNGEPSSSTFISAIAATKKRQDEAFDTDIPTNAVYVVLECSHLASTPTGTLTKPINIPGDIDQLQDAVQHIEDAVEPLIEQVGDITDDVDEITTDIAAQADTLETMVGTYTPAGWTALAWGEVVSDKYWNLVSGKAGLVNAARYFANPSLLPITPGRTIKATVKNAIIPFGESSAAMSFYDNDGNPGINSSLARRNWNSADTMEDNGDGTTTYTFLIPSGATQVGLYYKTEEVTFYISNPESINYSEDLDEHIEQVAGGGVTTSADSAKYYLKGASPKSFPNTKKIAILCAGQSNAEGRVPYADMPAEIKSAQPITNCHHVEDSESGAFASLNITGQWAFDLVTYYNLCVTANKEIYVMKWAAGGTSIDPLGDGTSHWTADYEDLSSPGYSLLRKFENEIRNHIASDGENFDIRAMLWHQGEGDRGGLGTGSDDRYYENLRNMVSYIRGIVGNERLPFITGTISHNSAQYDAKIEAAQQRLASEDPYFCLIDMSGAPLLDSYHFDDDSSVYFGQMAYNALIDYGVLSATKLTPVRPW